jgi:hypothetical protein
MSAHFETSAFSAKWNAMNRAERMHLRRLVRMGRKIEEPELAPLAPDYARWQMRRPWMKYFWFWFVPGLFIALGMTASVHPILVGITIALAGQAVWAYLSLRKTARASTPT